MTIRSKTVLIAALLVLGLAGLASYQVSNRTAPSPLNSGHQVQEAGRVAIEGFAFRQKTTRIKIGETITWINFDDATHTVTPATPSPDFKASPRLAKNDTYTTTFARAGSFAYFCEPHPYLTGTIEVEE